MTNFIEKLKQVAAGRSTSVYFDKCPDTEYGDIVTKETVRCVAESCHETNGKFWATASNCFDELVAVAEAADDWVHSYKASGFTDFKVEAANEAIEKLRQKVEGGGG